MAVFGSLLPRPDFHSEDLDIADLDWMTTQTLLRQQGKTLRQIEKEQSTKRTGKGEYALHVWDSRRSSWIELETALQTQSKPNKQTVAKSALSTAKKYGGLDPCEIAVYQAMVQALCELYELNLPHELLMMTLLFSQGYKFEIGDYIVTFPQGIFGGSFHCRVMEVLEDNSLGQSYRVKRIRLSTCDWRGGPHKGAIVTYARNCRVPLHHAFANKLVIVDEQKFNELYGDTFPVPAQYGDVLDVEQLFVVQEKVYSKKKKRHISKARVEMSCALLPNKRRRRVPLTRMDTADTRYMYSHQQSEANCRVRYDTSIFMPAKWRKPTNQ